MRKAYTEIISGFEQILRATTGAELEINVTPVNFDRESFVQECARIREHVDARAKDFMLTKPKTDAYYIALHICFEKYPYVSDRYFAEAFRRDRATILQARHRIPELFKVDHILRQTANTLLLETVASAEITD